MILNMLHHLSVMILDGLGSDTAIKAKHKASVQAESL